MKVRILTCSRCGKERTIETLDIEDLRTYSMERVFEACPECYGSAEGKLLNAIFGSKEPTLWKEV